MNTSLNTYYWFPRALTDNILEALRKHYTICGLLVVFTSHNDGDQSMIELHFQQGTELEQDNAKRIVIGFIMGFEEAWNVYKE